MGMIQCQKHGLTGFMISLDAELIKSINENQLHEDIIKISVVYQFDKYPDATEDDILGDYKCSYYISITKFYIKDLKRSYYVCSEEDENQLRYLFEDMNGGICGKCFNEYIEKNSIQII